MTKKILGINPELQTQDVIGIIRQSLRSQGGADNDFSSAELIDEEFAVRLAQATLPRQ